MSGVHPLEDNQARAVDPLDSVWLSASAGTGKTQVLSARVLRLLLTPGVRPENILCLTFTKAGAAEMAERVNGVLAGWVRMEGTRLATQLGHIGAPSDPDSRARARALFASVLDCPGGGLRIDTIHAFAQWLLAAFPEEAGLIPGTKPMEDRDRELLAHRVLADLLVGWEEHGDREPIEALEMLSLRMGADKARQWLMRCAEAQDLWLGSGGWQEPLRNRVEKKIICGKTVAVTSNTRTASRNRRLRKMRSIRLRIPAETKTFSVKNMASATASSMGCAEPAVIRPRNKPHNTMMISMPVQMRNRHSTTNSVGVRTG